MSSDDSNQNPPPDQPNDPNDPNAGGSGPQPEGGQPGEQGNQDNQASNQNQITQEVRHQQVSARVPESVGTGTFASGVLVLTGSHEFIIDFIQSVAQPRQVAQRVILPPSIMNNTINAIQKNIDNYRNRFGEIPELPKNQQQQQQNQQQQPSIEEIYQQLKLPDDVASGVYANTVLITHGQTEFCFDFITSFYPRSSVVARIYMAAPQVPRLLQTMSRSFEQFKQRVAQQQQQQPQQPGQAGEQGGGGGAPPADPAPGSPGDTGGGSQPGGSPQDEPSSRDAGDNEPPTPGEQGSGNHPDDWFEPPDDKPRGG